MNMQLEILPGVNSPLGAFITNEAVNFAFYSENAKMIELCLFDKAGNEFAKIELASKTDNVFHCAIKNLPEYVAYGIRVHGPHNIENGQRFNSKKLLLDPYAKAISEPFALNKAMFDNEIDSAPFMPKALVSKKPEFTPKPSFIPLSDSIIYELHLKGFSEKFPNLNESERGRWAALRNPVCVKYFKELGVNCLEILPCAAWIDERHLKQLGLKNYWGYNPIGFMAPDPRYAPNGFEDVYKTVKTLESHGIETIIDIVFNHSGESDENGPIVSMRGLDNSLWYALESDKSKYQNQAGTGNILNAANPFVLEYILETMRVWHLWGGVHGFRFDLSTIMARDENGFNQQSEFFTAIQNDPILSKLKMIAEPWDCETYQLGKFPNFFGEWNDRFRDDLRKFWLKDSVSIGAFAHAFCGSQSIFHEVSPAKSINFINAHDGFTLNDLVSYNSKHNEANGENNRDGSHENHSYNHGIEGETFDQKVRENRKKSQKSLLASLLLARGVPMLSMGSEFGQTQYGNNNSYCQDNDLNYLDWDKADHDLFEFTAQLISLRRRFGVFSANKFFDGAPQNYNEVKDIEWFNLWGAPPSETEWQSQDNGFLGALLSHEDGYLALVINRNAEQIEFQAPQNCYFKSAEILFDTDDFEKAINSIAPKSIKLMLVAREQNTQGEIDFVSKTYGIDIDWWDVDGNRHEVPNETKIAIMQEFGHDITNQGGRQKALLSYSKEFETRRIPYILAFDEGKKIKIEIAFGINEPEPIGEFVLFQNGEKIDVPIINQRELFRKKDCLENPFWVREYEISQLPMGRYDLIFNYIKCRLLIAPQKAYFPEDFDNSFGISAQLYAFKNTENCDFGDFSVLSDIMSRAGNCGAKMVATNPFHALFAQNRDLKSPYYPSHRAFIDPLYFPILNNGKSGGEFIEYENAGNLRIKELLRQFKNFKNNKSFEDFCVSGGQSLTNFALFNALCDHFDGCDPQNWPKGFQNPNSETCEKFAQSHFEEIRFQKYIQWRLSCELETAVSNKKAVLCRDLAIGSAPNGAEIWSNSDYYAKNVSIGAPPDPLGPLGQVWGLPPPNPFAIRKDGVQTLGAIFKANMAHAGALRIDHAMGILRQFWVPNTKNGKDGAYVQMPFNEIWAELRITSHENKCAIIAEDLGTVPFGFSETMNNANALSYKILLFENDKNGFFPASHLKEMAFACASTHDLPPLLAWWNAHDLHERRNLNLFSEMDYQSALEIRQIQKTQLIELITQEIGPHDFKSENEIIANIHAILAKSPARIAIIQLEDLAQTLKIQNLPGTNLERRNWQSKIEKSVKEIFESEFAQEIFNAVAKYRN